VLDVASDLGDLAGVSEGDPLVALPDRGHLEHAFVNPVVQPGPDLGITDRNLFPREGSTCSNKVGVESDRGAVLAFRSVRLPGPLAEPGMR
jgi:hypothetical protein